MHGRVDKNHQEIVAVLQAVGATVQDLSQVGAGCPDIVVGYRGKNYFFEIKSEKGKLKERQKTWHSLWRGQVHTIYNEYEAFEILGVSTSDYQGI